MICERQFILAEETAKALCFRKKTNNKTDKRIIYSIYIPNAYKPEPPYYIIYNFEPLCLSCAGNEKQCTCGEGDALFKIECSKEAYELFSLLDDAFRILSLHKQFICMDRLIEKLISPLYRIGVYAPPRLKVDAQPLDYIMFDPLFI